MEWTATVTDKKLINGVLSVSVNYSNGTENFTEVYNLNSGNTDVATIARNKVKGLLNIKDLDIIPLGPIDLTESQPVVVANQIP